MNDLERRLESLPPALDLIDPAQESDVENLAETLLDGDIDLDAQEADWCRKRDRIPMAAHLAAKLARSRRLAAALDGPAHVSMIFAVYKEHTRILTRDEHPHGEDFLRRKAAQLDWLTRGTSVAWDLTVVDDGCPESSGDLAERIAAEAGLEDRVRVRRLADAIAEDLPVTRPLTTPDDSRKGGSVVLGMWEAARIERAGHVIGFTDADLSTHLGQTGLLLDPILRGGADAAVGSRREPTSVVVKTGSRNTRGKLFIYLWKRLFPELGFLVDTQCGFKAWSAEAAHAVAADMLEKQFAFDIELLLKTELRRADSIVKVPVAWIDSEAASTTTDLQPYLPMLQAMAAMARAYLPPRPEGDAFATLLEGLDQDAWNRLVERVPTAIAEREPHTFGDWNGVGTNELSRILEGD